MPAVQTSRPAVGGKQVGRMIGGKGGKRVAHPAFSGKGGKQASIRIAKSGKSGKTSTSTPAGGLKKPKFRFKPGTVALRQIRKIQRNTAMLFQRLPFARIIRHELNEMVSRTNFPNGCRCELAAIIAMQEAFERFLVEFLEQGQLEAIHAKRQTVMEKDLYIVAKIRDCQIKKAM